MTKTLPKKYITFCFISMDILLLFYLDLTPIFLLSLQPSLAKTFSQFFGPLKPIVVKVFDKFFIGQIMVIYNKNVP